MVEGGEVQEADERLVVLEKQLGEHVAVYPQIGRLRDRIDGRLRLQSLLDRAALAHAVATSDEELQAALNALEEALEEHKAHPQVLALQERLRARLLFRRAEREYGIAPFADVRARYQSVVDLGGDDADQARQRLEQMAKDEKEARKIEQILTTAQEHLDNERYHQACKLLEPWTERVIPQSGRVYELFEAATEGLIEKIERELEVLQRHGKRRLDTRSIFEQVDELTGLDPERARRWDELVARCHMQLAQEATSADEALKHWQEAQRRASLESRWYPALMDGLRQADKKVEFGKVAVSSASEALAVLRGLLTRYPDDPEVQLHLADVYLRAGGLKKASEHLESAGQLLARAADDAAVGLSDKLSEVRGRLEEQEQSILDTLAGIERLVDGDKVQEAHERLVVLEKKLGEDAAAYPQAGRLRDRIDAQWNLRALLNRAVLAHDGAVSDEELQTVLEALEQALSKWEAHPQILALHKRLRARLLFREAEREYGLSPFAEVRSKYQAVIGLGGDDADLAKQRLGQIAGGAVGVEALLRGLPPGMAIYVSTVVLLIALLVVSFVGLDKKVALIAWAVPMFMYGILWLAAVLIRVVHRRTGDRKL